MNKHTSGPWKITQNAKTGCKVWGADGNPVAFIAGGIARSRVSGESPVPEWRRNAGLIAASPKLLECLKELFAATNPLMKVDPSEVHRIRVRAEKAIKAATDES